MGYHDNDLERPAYRSQRRGAPPPPSHSPSQEYRSRKGRDDYERENRHPNDGDTRRRNKRRSPPPLGDARRRRMAPPADSPPPRGRDTRPTPEREDYRKGYEAAKKEMLRNLSGATDEGPSRDTSRARRRDDSPPPRRRDESPVRRRRDSPERRERRRDDSPPRRTRADSPSRRERRRDSPERRSRERRRDDSREGRREPSRNRGRAESREGRRGDDSVWRERDEALRRSEETWQRSEARAQAAAPRRRSPTPDNRRRRSPSPECKEADDDYSLAPATRGVLMDDDAVSEASEAASELTADDDALSPVKPLRAMSKTSTRGRLQPMAFEDVLSVPTPLEPPSIRKIPLLQCFLERKKSTFGSGELTLKFEDKTLLVAKKTSRSGNYHIFDATCGRIGGGFSKKGGNYLGKIMAPKGTGVDLGGGSAHHRVLVDGSQQKNEHALFIHKRTSTLTSFVDGAKPRQVSVALPGNSAKSDLLTRFSHSDDKLTVLEQRQPKLVDGQYSLNFYGRATVASVKNFQLVPGLSDDTVVFQLGKIGDHDFNLDFAPPFTPFSAFALAVSQF